VGKLRGKIEISSPYISCVGNLQLCRKISTSCPLLFNPRRRCLNSGYFKNTAYIVFIDSRCLAASIYRAVYKIIHQLRLRFTIS